MATPEEIRRAREQSSIFSNLFDYVRANEAQLASEGRRPVLGGLLSKEPVMGTDTIRYEGFGPMLAGMLEPLARGVDAPRAAAQGLIPQEDMVGEALGTAGSAMIGGGAVAKPSGALGANTLRVYHGGPKKLSASEVEMRPDPEGTPIGFSVTDNPDVAEYYRDMRGGGSISEFDIDLDKANIISESELYEFIDDLESKLDADVSYEQIQRGLLDAGIDAIEYPDPEFGIRVVNPSILGANASKGSGTMTLWHGSPYDFNEFDLSKIGTGEGAQDLGRGFSLTDYEANAHLYTNPASRWGDLAAMERYRQAGPGRYYQVNVGAAPEQFLDWNKPWRDQVPEGTPLYDALAKREAVMLSQYADDPAMQAAIPRGKVSNMWSDNTGLEDAALQSGFVGNSRRNYSGDTEYTVFDPSLLRIDQKFDADGNVVSANASKSAGLLSVASDVSARGDQILGMLKSGRGSEVTDAMLDMGDGVKNTQLNQYLAENYDLPMDEASRLARAREMGLLDPAFHSTGKDFLNFVPSEFRGASFFGATPEGASRGASASANEGVGSGSKITMPVRVDTSGVEGLGSYARRDMNEFRASLPDRIYTEAEVDALMASDAAPLRGNWSDFFDDLTDYDALRQFRDENPTKEIPDGIVKFRPKRPVSYSKDLKADLSGRQFAHYSEGMSERPTSEYVKSQGNTGFTMMDESGLALAMVDPTKVRSQFARFDPRLSHLSNVTAANASPISGLLAQSGVSSEQAQRIEDYLYRTGLLQ